MREWREWQLREFQQETARQLRELQKSQQETTRQLRELQETARQLQEWQSREFQRETARQMKETDREIDKLSEAINRRNAFCTLIENLISARLWEKFADYPYNLQRDYQRVKLYDDDYRVLTDIDILLADGTYVMAVEVKEKLARRDDVELHVKRMGLIKKYPPDEAKGKHLLGTMAGGEVDPDVAGLAYANGFFVLELAGEAVRLVAPPSGFTPKEW
jgi:CHAT domain-containing protein